MLLGGGCRRESTVEKLDTAAVFLSNEMENLEWPVDLWQEERIQNEKENWQWQWLTECY